MVTRFTELKSGTPFAGIVAADDVLAFVDTSDATDDASGSSFPIEVDKLLSWGPTAAEKTGTTYSLGLDDARTLYFSDGSQVTVTIPTNATTAIDIGTRVLLVSTGAGGLTLSNAGVTLLPATPYKTVSQGESIYLEKVAADLWIVLGGTAT